METETKRERKESNKMKLYHITKSRGGCGENVKWSRLAEQIGEGVYVASWTI